MPNLTPLVDAITASTLYRAGIPVGKIAERLDMDRATVYGIVNRRGAWSVERAAIDGETFQQYSQEVKNILRAKALALANVALDNMAVKMDKASAAQSGVCFGILVEKAALLGGDATARVDVVTRADAADLDALAERLRASLVSAARDDTIDVTPMSAVAPTADGSADGERS